MSNGWNPGRRNRHAGTAAHGHGQDNVMVIPDPTRGRLAYFEQLGAPVNVHRRIAGTPMRFFVEEPLQGSFYPCTIDDICTLLTHCPLDDWKTVDFVVLRQPTRKQRTLSPVWGRAIFHYDGVCAPGPAVVLEAQTLAPFKWPRELSPDSARELDRLRTDGHDVQFERRHWCITPTAQSLRYTMLYRTLLHEIGHHVDYANDLVSDLPWSRHTHKRKEDFAHRYAHDVFARLKAQDVLPFPRQLNEATLTAEGLSPEWFEPPLMSPF
ncbi:hypothetical protein [Ottowia testudinis]|uniref:Uncharacterized protein n=1 Tax=Ottowia testudinis TaxID=2816950 RepID=A0A975CFG6_9BURK|nr:hypothetical protein [Ottowia testudinis]QTD44832.1 hypothetical protein J1M35_17525 [Ottowia testudinis]